MKSKKHQTRMLDIVRKHYPTMMAKHIVGVQPMPYMAGIFAPNIPKIDWSAWRKTTSWWPRRSITGNIIIGRINKRGHTNWQQSGWNGPTSGSKRIHEFATNKELFEALLKGETGE